MGVFSDTSSLSEDAGPTQVGTLDDIEVAVVGGGLALGGGVTKSFSKQQVAMRYSASRSQALGGWIDNGHDTHLTGQEPPAHSPELESPAITPTSPAASAARYSASVMVS